MKPNMKHLAVMVAVIVFGIVIPLTMVARTVFILLGDAP